MPSLSGDAPAPFSFGLGCPIDLRWEPPNCQLKPQIEEPVCLIGGLNNISINIT